MAFRESVSESLIKAVECDRLGSIDNRIHNEEIESWYDNCYLLLSSPMSFISYIALQKLLNRDHASLERPGSKKVQGLPTHTVKYPRI
ncbi:hypothetical protein BN873_470023 [Candidatus Competibacter denitrificans Run_A_D11]|uniref:Uncharacterized protein n=1 Tax=Candidatus Competibacter denitrificans Run_A_D11 TaxID=1400863 RepID=W6M5V7_9GAMM|nr:hypothetical protein BN873_470023 [Candidatus Competibacter denitrificans Run_A_D11]